MNNFRSNTSLTWLSFLLVFIGCKVATDANSKPAIKWEEANAVVPDYYLEESDREKEEEPSVFRYEDAVYKSKIGTPMMYIKGQPLTFPMVYLGDNRKLSLHFDDLTAEFNTYSYEIIHCNSDWTPSGLTPQEFMRGFMNGFINDYEYSFNTLVRYIHYSLTFPNEEIQFKLSGNYMLKVYENNDREDVVLGRRFIVVNKQIPIKADVRMATLARYRDYKQEVDFTLDLTNYPIVDPYQDLKVVVVQNRWWNNAIRDLKPLFVRTPELGYNYEEENLFDGNNEFRFFDMKDIRYQSINVDGIQNIGGKTHVFLLPEEPRSFKRYYFQNDLNGNRLIKRDESEDGNRDSDYLQTHFTLKRASPVFGGEVYVFGQLSDWQIQEEFKMKYVEVNNEYVLEVPLKQGYYNYNYVVVPNGAEQGDMSVIEGTHSDTENDYYILVYHRRPGEIYDRLVGFQAKNSFNN